VTMVEHSILILRDYCKERESEFLAIHHFELNASVFFFVVFCAELQQIQKIVLNPPEVTNTRLCCPVQRGHPLPVRPLPFPRFRY